MKKYEKIEIVSPTGYGHYDVVVNHYGKSISAVTNSMPVIDKYMSGDRGWKTAGNRLYDFVVYINKSQKN